MALIALPVVGPVRVFALEEVDVVVVVRGQDLAAVVAVFGAGHVTNGISVNLQTTIREESEVFFQ